MKIPKLEEMNSERFLNEVFNEEMRRQWVKSARLRRHVYLWLFIIGMLCMLYAATIQRMTLCILSMFLATISLVIVTKYDTQIHFLRVLQVDDERKLIEPDHS